MKKTLILINPWIFDFAAYDMWSKPIGLYYLASALRNQGFDINLIDCTGPLNPEMNAGVTTPKRKADGTGKYFREVINKLDALSHIERPYSRYGIPLHVFKDFLKRVKKPDAILVTSLMTYWYPGVHDVISITKEIHPGVPVILGGIYARLCREHAQKLSGADFVISKGFDESLSTVLDLMDLNEPVTSQGIFQAYPAFDLLSKIDYIPLITSIGCPYRCEYCASSFLYPQILQRDIHDVLDEIIFWNKNHDVKNFAFYDDALLFNSEKHISILLEKLISLKARIHFHTPNALHVREISSKIATQLYDSGFKTIRLGFETADMEIHDKLDNKVKEGELDRAVINLKKAGFRKDQIGAYILMGLPGQTVESVMDSVNYAGERGIAPYLAEYSPIPHTPLWNEAKTCVRYDIEQEPLFHNNTLVPCWDEDKLKRIPELRLLVKKYRLP